MIFDKIENFHKYATLGARFPAACELMQQVTETEFAPGRKETADEGVYANCIEGETSPLAECKAEVHRRFADIHLVLAGEETILVQGLADAEPLCDYCGEDDYQLFAPAGNAQTFRMREGYFLLLLPDEVHTVMVAETDEPQALRKAVVKVKLD